MVGKHEALESKSKRTVGNRRVHSVIEWTIKAGLRILEIKRIGHIGGIESLAHELMLLVLESLGRRERIHDAQEQRVRVSRQPARQQAGVTWLRGPIGRSSDTSRCGRSSRRLATSPGTRRWLTTATNSTIRSRSTSRTGRADHQPTPRGREPGLPLFISSTNAIESVPARLRRSIQPSTTTRRASSRRPLPAAR